MRAFILAAGFGTRLKPITDHIPKALVSVCGAPLLERALTFCREAGFSEIGVNAHYLHRQVAVYRNQSPVAFELFVEDGAIRGTGGGLYFAREYLAREDSFFVCNADILYWFDLEGEIAAFKKSGDLARLLAVPAGGQGTILLDAASGRFAGTPRSGAGQSGAMAAEFIGAALYRREFLDFLTPDDFSVVPVWQRCADAGAATSVAMLNDCYWRDVGTPASLAAAHFEVLDGRSPVDVPEWLAIDREARRCHHRDLPRTCLEGLGPYSWVECADIPAGVTISRSVVFAGADLSAGRTVSNALLTPFGEVRFGL